MACVAAKILNFTTFFLIVNFVLLLPICLTTSNLCRRCCLTSWRDSAPQLGKTLFFFFFWRGGWGEDLLRPWVRTQMETSHTRTDDAVFDNVVKQAERLAACSKHTNRRSECGPFCSAQHTPAAGKQMEACLFWALKPQHASHTGQQRRGGERPPETVEQPQVSVRRSRERGGVKTKWEVLDRGRGGGAIFNDLTSHLQVWISASLCWGTWQRCSKRTSFWVIW